MMTVPSQIIAVLNHPAFAPKKLASLEMLAPVGAPLHLEHKERLTWRCRTCSTSCTG